MSNHTSGKAQWIWLGSLDGTKQPNQYADFRVEFELPAAPKHAVLRTSVDSDVAAWLNGRLAGCGQFDDFPGQPTFSQHDVTALLTAGHNVLALTATYCGVPHFSYAPGEPGLWYELEVDGRVVLASGPRTLCRPSRCYLSAESARISPQRGFTFCYDAAGDDGWIPAGYRPDRSWTAAVVVRTQVVPMPRPVPVLDVRPRAVGVIVAQGLLKRCSALDATVGKQVQEDFLSARRSWELFDDFQPISDPTPWPVRLSESRLTRDDSDADGFYLVVDLGREEVGFPALELNASEGGCIIDVAVGEHLDDLRVRAHVGGRNFAGRYRARAGQQSFAYCFDRYAGRYVQLHVTQLRGTLELRYAGLVPTEYPVSSAGEFASCDRLANQIWTTSRRTLHLCMFEHYEDCPWREQGLYANDSRNQMLSGYYAFGNYDFARASLDLLARSTGDDGYQDICAPSKFEITIPSFTLTWFLAMDDYLMYSGDVAFVERSFPLMRRMLASYVATLADNLLPCPTGKRYWHFYDWMPRLDGTRESDCTQFDCLERQRFDAPLNLLLVLALQAVANQAKYVGEEAFGVECLRHAEALRPAIHERFWDAARGGYRTTSEHRPEQPLAELVQSLAVLAGVGSEAQRRELRHELMRDTNGMTATTLSQSLYKFEAILTDDTQGPVVAGQVVDDWSKMLFAGATTFWETRKGGWDFHHAGSLCHGWSGIPAYFYGAYGLGIKPLEPGFRRYSVKPLFGLPLLRGVVPSPHGEIGILLERSEDIYRSTIKAPLGTESVIDDSRVRARR